MREVGEVWEKGQCGCKVPEPCKVELQERQSKVCMLDGCIKKKEQ